MCICVNCARERKEKTEREKTQTNFIVYIFQIDDTFSISFIYHCLDFYMFVEPKNKTHPKTSQLDMRDVVFKRFHRIFFTLKI